MAKPVLAVPFFSSNHKLSLLTSCYKQKEGKGSCKKIHKSAPKPTQQRIKIAKGIRLTARKAVSFHTALSSNRFALFPTNIGEVGIASMRF